MAVDGSSKDKWKEKKGVAYFIILPCARYKELSRISLLLVHHTMFLFVTTLILSSSVSAQSVCDGERLMKTE